VPEELKGWQLEQSIHCLKSSRARGKQFDIYRVWGRASAGFSVGEVKLAAGKSTEARIWRDSWANRNPLCGRSTS